ncbi:MAG TPA: hypothetical protein VNL94_01955 [Candidatus Binatia bacterium]|nr:hypothetical protein [Candidatus Binatia bacterium]
MTRDALRSIEHGSGGPPADSPSLQELGTALRNYVTAFRLLDHA